MFQWTRCTVSGLLSHNYFVHRLIVNSHLGCQSIRSGEAKMSLIAASQLILVPDMPTSLTSLHMLSPDSRCYSQVSLI